MLRLTAAQGAAGALSLLWFARRNLARLMPIYHAQLNGYAYRGARLGLDTGRRRVASSC